MISSTSLILGTSYSAGILVVLLMLEGFRVTGLCKKVVQRQHFAFSILASQDPNAAFYSDSHQNSGGHSNMRVSPALLGSRVRICL